MTKVKPLPFLVVFLAAFLLSKILMSVLSIPIFSLDDPTWLSLGLDVTSWLLAWSVSYIVYLKVHGAFENRKQPQIQTEETPDLT